MLGDRLYMGGGVTSGSRRNEARLYIYTPTTDSWTTLDITVILFATIAYHNEVVLVGGRKYLGTDDLGPYTNQLWTLDEQNGWKENLPPMNVRRSAVSAVGYGNYLLVAGGHSDVKLCDIVEVYNGQMWSAAEPLPIPCQNMKSSVLDSCWYLMGGNELVFFYDVFYAPLDSLIANRQSNDTSRPSSIWKRLTDAPHYTSTPAIFGNRLTAIGGRGEGALPISSIHAFSPYTNLWIEIGNLPAAGCDCCTTVLSTKELIVIGGFMNDTSQVFKATVQGWCVLFVITILIIFFFFQ